MTPHRPLSGRLAEGVTVVTFSYPSLRHPDHNPFTHSLALELEAQGLRVTVVAPQRVPAVRRAGPRVQNVDEVEIRRPAFVSPGGRRPFRRARVRLSHRNFARAAVRAAEDLPRPSVYLGHFLRPSGVTAVDLGRLHDRPSVVVLAEGENREAADDVFGVAANAEALREATGVIAVSEELGLSARDHYQVDPDRVAVVPNAVAIDEFVPGDRVDARREVGVPDDAFVAAHVARRNHNKGWMRLAAALDLLDGEVTGMFVGRGPRDMPTRQPTVVRRLPHGDVPTHLRAADVFVLPSLEEGASNAVLEAMACGLPLVVSDRPFMREIATEDEAVFVDPTSPEEIAAALGELRADPGRRAAMGAAGRARMERYPLGRRVAELVDWMDPLVADFNRR